MIVAGGLLSHLAFVPLLWFLGQHLPGPLYPGKIPIAEMREVQIFSTYVRSIGIGAIFMAGVLGIIKSMPVMVKSLTLGFRELFKGKPRAPQPGRAPTPTSRCRR